MVVCHQQKSSRLALRSEELRNLARGAKPQLLQRILAPRGGQTSWGMRLESACLFLTAGKADCERGCSGRGWNSKAVRTSCPWLTWVCLWPVAEFSTRLGTSEGTPWTWACFSGWSGQDQHLGAGREAPGGIVLRFEGSLSQAQTLHFPDLECEGLVELYTLTSPYS